MIESLIDNIDRTWDKSGWDEPNFEYCNSCGCVLYEEEQIEGDDGEVYCLECTLEYNNKQNENL